MNLKQLKKEILEKLREKLADIEHQRWSDWQKYVHSKCSQNKDGSLTIPVSLVSRWGCQIETDYKDLSEKEKDSDREQVDRYLSHLFLLLKQAITKTAQEALKECEVEKKDIMFEDLDTGIGIERLEYNDEDNWNNRGFNEAVKKYQEKKDTFLGQ